MRKRKWMKVGACALSAVLIMGLYAGPAFADWVENQNGARMWVQDGKAQTGWQQINGKWYYFDESGKMKTGWLQSGEDWYYLYDVVHLLVSESTVHPFRYGNARYHTYVSEESCYSNTLYDDKP